MSMYTYACMKPKSGPKPPLGFRVLPSLGIQSPSRGGQNAASAIGERKKKRERVEKRKSMREKFLF